MKSILHMASIIAMAWVMCNLTSCIQDEALNAEADIVRLILPDQMLTDTPIDYDRPFDNVLKAYPLTVEVKAGTDISRLAPDFELTPGASIDPAGGSMHDFRNPVRYTVTSEDGHWHRTYSVEIRQPQSKDIPTTYHFETVRRQDNYYIFYEEATGSTSLTWASGNAGFAMAAALTGITDPNDYPTTLSTEGYVGNCLRLVTRLTGDWGAKVGKPIAAGNLFIGSFDLANAIINSLGSTRFGTPFYQLPKRLTGYFKFKAGPQFYDNGQYTDQKDVFNIYAVFFEKTADVPYLDGHLPGDNFEHPNLVASAVIDAPQVVETDTWRRFEIPFDYDRYGKTIDPVKLTNGQYSLAIIFSSSKGGDLFKGAPGSTLLIDEVTLETIDN